MNDGVATYSNASDIDVSKIPQCVIDDLADLFLGIYNRKMQEPAAEKQSA